MDWIVPRTLKLVLAVALGMGLGALLGSIARWPQLGLIVGGLVAAALFVVRDLVHGNRLMEWLRGSQSARAPRDTGFWGELAYRIERALRLRERQIEEERERLRQFLAAIEASPNGVILLDGSDQIEWCNSVAAQHFGLEPERDRLQRATNLIRSPAFVAYLQEGRFEEPVTFTDSRGRATLSVLVRPYGEGWRLVLSQDVTERVRSEAMRRDFVANVSHEIRTPLTVLAGFVETLAQLPLSEAERQRVLTLMQQQTLRMQTLVADLLTLAQLEGSPLPLPDRWLAVDELMRRAQGDAAALSSGRHDLTSAGGAEAEVAGNEAELLSALTNLLNNAVRYTPAGGHVELRFVWRDDGGAVFEVADDGIGIAREHLPRLTERFYRVDGSRSRDTGGTGLGLAIVKHVVQRHGGEIDIVSEPGKGSTFRLVLPPLRVRRRGVSAGSAVTAGSGPEDGADGVPGAPGASDGDSPPQSTRLVA
jgi:two-component system phosphate regulon sensor histidine kinase PhoR